TTLANSTGATLNINGSDYTVDGADTYRILQIGSGAVTIDNLTLRSGFGGNGGAVQVAAGATFTLTNSTIADSAATDGGGIYNSGTLAVNDSVVSGNSASRSGGGIYNGGTMQMTRSTLSGNSAPVPAEGGGLSNYGTASIVASTAAQNTAAFGAALYTRGSLTVANSTLSGNTASNLGGAIYIFWSGSLLANNTTITGNSAANAGGGLLNNRGSLTVNNSIVANTSNGGNCFGTGSGIGNLADDGTCAYATQSDSINLGPLQDNGGPTLTHALLGNSSALDSGDASICAGDQVENRDQRSIARPFNTGCDIGAYELFNAAPVLATIGNQTVFENQALEFTVAATDAEGHNLTFSIANAPTGATLIDNGDGTATFRWTPTFDQAGSYADVLITVNDDGFGTQMQSEIFDVIVGNVNRPARFEALADQSVSEGGMIAFNILASDPDGDPITLAMANPPTGASFTDNGGGSGGFEWAPGFEQSGNYTVMFSATDSGTPIAVGTTNVTLTVGNVNRSPALGLIGSRTVDEGATLSFSIAAADPDGDTLSFALGNAPAGASFTDNGNGTASFDWTPDFGEAGEYTDVQFVVTDGGTPAQSAGESISITVGDVNRAPALTPIGDRVVNEGELLEFVLTAGDPDGDDVGYTALTSLPTGATFTDNGDGTARFAWTPDFGQAGNYILSFHVFDSAAAVGTDTEFVIIAVGDVNRLPTLDPIGGRTAFEGRTLEFVLTASDPDGDDLSYPTPPDLPAGASFTDNGDGTASFAWTPTGGQAGSVQVAFTVTDGSATASESVTITTARANTGGGGATGLVEFILTALALLGLRRRQRGSRHPAPGSA
ncbi:MAG: tandem-95 repeat protein, partial [Pseudomonadota bacterium]